MNATHQPSARSRARLLPLIALVVAAAVGAWFLRDTLTFESLRDNRAALIAFRDAHYGAAVGVFVLAYVVIVALSLPGATVATLTGGFLFATFPGALYNLAGASIGAILIFLAARAGLGARLSARIDASAGAIQRIKAGIDDNQWSMLFLMRLLPAVPFFVANLLPALLNVPLYRFAVTTVLGIIPGTVILTSVGSGLGQVFAAGTAPDLSILTSPQVVLPLLGLCALAALPLLIKALGRRKRS